MGLICGPLLDDAVMDRVLQKRRLKDKYFKSTNRISCGELEKAFLRPSTPRADLYKLGLALIIEGVFNAPDSHAGIKLPTLSIVDNLDMFYSYPWGRGECWKLEGRVHIGFQWRRLRDDDESGDSDDEGVGEETVGDKSGDSNGKASDERDSEDEHTRTPQTGRYSILPMHRRTSSIHTPSKSYVRQGQTSGASLTTAEVEELLLDQRTLIEIRLHTVKLEIMQHVTNEFVKAKDFISTLVPPAPSRSTPPTAQAANEPTILDGNGRETDPVPKCAEPQGGAGMESEPALNSDDDDVAFGGSGKHEDERVASPTGVAEADGGCGMDFEPEKNSHNDEVPSDGSGNHLDKPIVSASGVAEVDGK
ncbi:Hypothetical predicted protein [Olea europaea subsp. europaea]|uniref:DUF1985 domain-containing protein n=1 Tax=Olea europaea subsp. europaea TaxID=158383 RepID=A0A8S0V3U0_OLEEU|nr:Hypothetical predicted protein [Olea europaea subsp. europaea]